MNLGKHLSYQEKSGKGPEIEKSEIDSPKEVNYALEIVIWITKTRKNLPFISFLGKEKYVKLTE